MYFRSALAIISLLRARNPARPGIYRVNAYYRRAIMRAPTARTAHRFALLFFTRVIIPSRYARHALNARRTCWPRGEIYPYYGRLFE